MRKPKCAIPLAAATFAVVLLGCEVDTQAEDPAEMEPVEEEPGDQNGDPADAEGQSPDDGEPEGGDAGDSNGADETGDGAEVGDVGDDS